jgi:outer membrane protein TolC
MRTLLNCPRILAALASVGLATNVYAQFGAAVSPAAQPRALSLAEAVRFALAHHPLIEGAVARIATARAARDAAASGQLPTLDLTGQVNRATGNAVAGSSFPLPGVPAVSGPVGTTSLQNGAWGTTTAFASSLPIVGVYRANRLTHSRESAERAAAAGDQATRIDVVYGAAAAYLRAMAGVASLRAALANAQRARTLLNMTEPLVEEQLRPGADLARAQAELATAQIEVARAERERNVANALLGAALGSDEPVTASDSAPPSSTAMLEPTLAPNPQIVDARASLEAARGERSVASLGWWPRVDLVGTFWGRGSGVRLNGVVADLMHDGLSPGVSNWALGVLVSWPLLARPAIIAEMNRTDAVAAAAAARVRATEENLTAARRAAEADTAGAAAVARRTGEALADARTALDQATARYGAGLSSVTDVADAQRVLARAEAADAVAAIDVKLSRLALARAMGDLRSLLAETGAGGAR